MTNTTDWQSLGTGPNCPKCKDNSQVLKTETTYRPRLKIPGTKYSGIPLPYTNTVSGWTCHSCGHMIGD